MKLGSWRVTRSAIHKRRRNPMELGRSLVYGRKKNYGTSPFGEQFQFGVSKEVSAHENKMKVEEMVVT